MFKLKSDEIIKAKLVCALWATLLYKVYIIPLKVALIPNIGNTLLNNKVLLNAASIDLLFAI